MSESTKIVILSGNEIPQQETGTGTEFSGELHSGEKALSKLERAWPTVMERLRRIVERDLETDAGGFHVSSVEFGISIEAGFNFVVSGTGTADARITFSRKST